MKKLSHLQMRLLKIRVMLFPSKRTAILKKSGIFAGMGEHCIYVSTRIPEEPYMLKLHNNVVIAANVNFITHDIMNDMLSQKINAEPGKVLSKFIMGTIEIFDNVAIGINSTIMYNTKIGPNAIIAAGSVVTKDVPEGAIVGGNPARIIGRVDELIEKRKKVKDAPTDMDSIDDIMKYYWKANNK